MIGLISAAVAAPWLGVGAIAFMPRARAASAQTVAGYASALSTFLGLFAAWRAGDTESGMVLPGSFHWLVGLDALGTVLFAALGVAALVAMIRMAPVPPASRGVYGSVLALQAFVGLALVARDAGLWAIAAASAIAVLTLLTSRWGNAESSFTGSRLFWIAGFGGALILPVLLVLTTITRGDMSLEGWWRDHPLAVAPMNLQRPLWWALTLGIGLFAPIVPFHGGQVGTVERLPRALAPVSLLTVPVLALSALYRLSIAVMPGAARDGAVLLLVAGALSALYGAWGALSLGLRPRGQAYVAVALTGAILFAAGLMTQPALLVAVYGTLLMPWALVALSLATEPRESGPAGLAKLGGLVACAAGAIVTLALGAAPGVTAWLVALVGV